MPGDETVLPPDGTGKKGEAFASALAEMDLGCSVEERGGLAVIRPRGDAMSRLADPAVRRRVVGLGRTHGFTHVAVTVGHT